MSDYSMRSNVFVYGRPLKPDEFLGREAELGSVINRLHKSESTAVVGEPHIGKTSFLSKLADLITKDESYRQRLFVSNIDLQPIARTCTPVKFWNDALDPLRKYRDDKDLAKLYRKTRESKYDRTELEDLLAYLASKEYLMVLLLDEFDCLLAYPNSMDESFFALLRSLATRTGGLVLVITSRLSLAEMNKLGRNLLKYGSPLFNHFIEVRLRPFDDDLAIALFKRAGDKLSQNDQRFISRVTGRNPFLLQAMAGTLLEVKDGERRHAQAAELFYERIATPHFAELWSTLDEKTHTAAVIICLLELHGYAFGQDFAYGEIERIVHLGVELRKLERLGLAEQVSKGWQFDLSHLLIWRGERWTVSSQAFVWWVRDNIISEIRDIPVYDEWLRKKHYSYLLTQEQWDWLRNLLKNIPADIVNGIGGIARKLIEEIMEIKK